MRADSGRASSARCFMFGVGGERGSLRREGASTVESPRGRLCRLCALRGRVRSLCLDPVSCLLWRQSGEVRVHTAVHGHIYLLRVIVYGDCVTKPGASTVSLSL